MPIKYRQGDLLESGAGWLTVPVNLKGVMGAGLAKQFTRTFHGLERAYKLNCRWGTLKLGTPVAVFSDRAQPGIILFATKDDWRNPSELSWVDDGLNDLSEIILEIGIRSIAIPPLGCGLGGLDWNDVRPLIEQHLSGLDAQILVYEPGRRSAS